jgi:hypothetical protein
LICQKYEPELSRQNLISQKYEPGNGADLVGESDFVLLGSLKLLALWHSNIGWQMNAKF